MSALPEIIKTVARRMYKKNQKSIQSQSKVLEFDDIFSQSHFSQTIDLIASKDLQKSSQHLKVEQKQQDPQYQTKENEELRSYFIKTHKRKLKNQYPSFQQEQIEHIAKEVWEKLSEYQISVYNKKFFKFLNEDYEAYQSDLSDTNENQRNLQMKSRAKLQSTPINENSDKQQLPQMESQEDESNVQSSLGDQPSDIQGRSNQETKTSTVLCDHSQNIRLPLIDQVPESQRSFPSDQQVQQKARVGQKEHKNDGGNQGKIINDQEKTKMMNKRTQQNEEDRDR